MENAIEFNNVSKKFKKGEKFNSLRDTIPHFFKRMAKSNKKGGLEEREFWAVGDVNFQIKKGEVVGIIGPNGAGKSTILKLLSGILRPTKGNLNINGRLSALIEVTAGFHPELTGRENVFLNGTILGMKRKEIEEKFEDIVEFSGIREFIDTPVKRYSSGMFSRLGFSVAAHVNPDVLLVDEVLSVGDIAFQSKCAEKMRELLKSGVTIAIVSHNMSLIQSLCSRVILLNKGEVIKEGSPDDVLPFYENLVFRQKESEFKKKLEKSSDYKVKVKDKTPIVVKDIKVVDDKNNHTEGFETGSELTVNIEYEARESVDNPIFSMDIVRSDGVVCCSSNTKENNVATGTLKGFGQLKVNLGKINLAPGIYLPKVTIWDKDMIHAYSIGKKDILRIEMSGHKKYHDVVFLSKMDWKVGK